MSEYNRSLRDEDVEAKRSSSGPTLIALYIISFAILAGSIITFIIMGNNLSSKSTSISNLTDQLNNLTAVVNGFAQSINSTQTDVQALNTSVSSSIKNINNTVTDAQAGVKNLTTQLNGYNVSIGQLSDGVQILYGNVSTISSSLNGVQTQVNGILTPVNIPLTISPVSNNNYTTPTTLTTGTPFAVTTNHLANINGNGYISCSVAVVFNSNVTSPTLNIGYVLGSGNFTSVFTSAVSNTDSNIGFAVTNIPVSPANNNQSLSFQWALVDSTATLVGVENIATSASCSWFA